MTEFRDMEEVYDRCLAEGTIVKREELSLQKVRDSVDIAQEALESANDSFSKKRWNIACANYYDALRELVEAFVSFDMIKSLNHQCLFSYICVKHPELELSWEFFEKIRTCRNGIHYYSSKVMEKEVKEIKITATLYFNLFKKELQAKIKDNERSNAT